MVLGKLYKPAGKAWSSSLAVMFVINGGLVLVVAFASLSSVLLLRFSLSA